MMHSNESYELLLANKHPVWQVNPVCRVISSLWLSVAVNESYLITDIWIRRSREQRPCRLRDVPGGQAVFLQQILVGCGFAEYIADADAPHGRGAPLT